VAWSCSSDHLECFGVGCQHELLLIGRRGSFPPPPTGKRPSSVISQALVAKFNPFANVRGENRTRGVEPARTNQAMATSALNQTTVLVTSTASTERVQTLAAALTPKIAP
jgi:hypothetical protein